MTKFTKIIAGVLAISTMAISMTSISTNANEIEDNSIIFNDVNGSSDEYLLLDGLSTTPPIGVANEDVTAYDNSIPSNVWNLSSSGRYDFSGVATGKANLYTNYLFTGVNSLAISVTNKNTSTLTVTVYKNGIILTKVGSFIVNPNTSSVKSYNVKSNNNYYIAFSSPCNFSGFVQ